jgi:hypothetical protein
MHEKGTAAPPAAREAAREDLIRVPPAQESQLWAARESRSCVAFQPSGVPLETRPELAAPSEDKESYCAVPAPLSQKDLFFEPESREIPRTGPRRSARTSRAQHIHNASGERGPAVFGRNSAKRNTDGVRYEREAKMPRVYGSAMHYFFLAESRSKTGKHRQLRQRLVPKRQK